MSLQNFPLSPNYTRLILSCRGFSPIIPTTGQAEPRLGELSMATKAKAIASKT